MLLPDVGRGAVGQEVASVEIYSNGTPSVSGVGIVSNRPGIPWYAPNELAYLMRGVSLSPQISDARGAMMNHKPKITELNHPTNEQDGFQ